jgi:hypothetical protein
MAATVQQGLAALRGLGGVEEMRGLAARGYGAGFRPGVNAHIHLPPNFSAFESVGQAVDLAAAQNVRIVGATNYYDYGVYGAFAARARRAGIFPLFGLEIISLEDALVRDRVLVNDPGNPGRMYVCGKGAVGVAAPSPRAAALLATIRRNDTGRMAEMTARTARLFAAAGLDTGLDAGAVIDRIVARHGVPRETVTIQERHIAMAFQEALFDRLAPAARAARLAEVFGAPCEAPPDDAVKVQGEIRSRLLKAGKPAFVKETFLGFAEAYELILALRAVPCYPTLADGADPVCAYEDPPEALIERMRDRKLFMAEYIPVRNTPAVLRRYVAAVRAAGIPVVAGTEHNTLDLLPIEPACVGGAPIPDDLRAIFLEGARVVAAHQFLAVHGTCGYVDAEGALNPDYRSDEERIAAFAALGAAVIQRYVDTFPQE